MQTLRVTYRAVDNGLEVEGSCDIPVHDHYAQKIVFSFAERGEVVSVYARYPRGVSFSERYVENVFNAARLLVYLRGQQFMGVKSIISI